jgi:hypothetical protein
MAEGNSAKDETSSREYTYEYKYEDEEKKGNERKEDEEKKEEKKKNEDEKIKPWFNYKKATTPLYFVYTIGLLGACTYGFYCYFTNAKTFLGITNILLKGAIHNNIVTEALALIVISLAGILGLFTFASGISRAYSWRTGEFSFVEVPVDWGTYIYKLPQCIQRCAESYDTHHTVSTFGKVHAWLSGLSAYSYMLEPDGQSSSSESRF